MNIGYCTNVHSGPALDEVMKNLRRYAIPVKEQVCAQKSMGIGLWLSDAAVREVLNKEQWAPLLELLESNGLVPYTFNAFPFADFHQRIVKKSVYLPDWTTTERREYTTQIATLMTRLLPSGSHGTISTLPLGWRRLGPEPSRFHDRCASRIRECAEALEQLHQQTGVHIRLCLEPEPGCAIQSSIQLQRFFEDYLSGNTVERERCQQYLGACHDICHSAVMFEPQTEALERYRQAGIKIGKVQISSAIEARGPELSSPIHEALMPFAEPRYMHQTCVQNAGEIRYFDDLPEAMGEASCFGRSSVWRTHFHVPIQLASLGPLHTTRHCIRQCLDWVVGNGYSTQLETETYAWDVTPSSGQESTLVDSLVAELQWVNREYPELAEAKFNQIWR